MEGIILAGGFGTRLQSRLDGVPKPMVQVGVRPFLEILVDRLAESGFDRLILSVGHLAGVIEDHFGCAWRGVPVEYVVEEEPLGTGGAIRKAMGQVAGPSAFVFNGDTWLDVDYGAMNDLHQRTRASITVAVTHVSDVARFGGVELSDGKVVRFIEKGHTGEGWINGGVYVLSRDFPWPGNLPERFSFEADVLLPLLPSLDHSIYLSAGRFIDIGVPEDLDRARGEFGTEPV